MQLTADLESTRDEMLRYFGLNMRIWPGPTRPGNGRPGILQHLTDSETGLYDRIRRVISEPRQVIWWYDEDAWPKALN